MGAIKAPFMDKTQKQTRPRHVGVGHHEAHEAKVEKTRAAAAEEQARTEEDKVPLVAAAALAPVAEDTLSKLVAGTTSKHVAETSKQAAEGG